MPEPRFLSHSDRVRDWQERAHANGRCVACNQPHTRMSTRRPGQLAMRCTVCAANARDSHDRWEARGRTRLARRDLPRGSFHA
jgi:hypothetical protein